MNKVYWFGCVDGDGHCWRCEDIGSYSNMADYGGNSKGPPDWPFGWKIDGGFIPKGQKHYDVQGAAQLTHEEGWTILAFVDKTGDGRPGSNTAFVIHDTVDFNTLLSKAAEQYPRMFRRFKFKIVDVTDQQ